MAPTVLIVDDSEVARSSIRRAIESSELDVRVLEAADGAEALPLAVSGEVDIVVSDIVMPKLDGIQLLRAIRQTRDAETLPVILVTSQSDVETRSLGFEVGASDYLSKPFSAAELVCRIQVQLRLLKLQEELRRATERFRVLGAHDELTGLANRRHLLETARRELARSRRHSFAMSIIVADVDSFRDINTRVGYLVGDAIIIEMAQIVGKSLRNTDLLARLGGEKFAILLPQTEGPDARLVANRLCTAVREHAFPGHAAGEVTLSLGAATYPSGRLESVDEIINAAEAALDRAKELGGARAESWDNGPRPASTTEKAANAEAGAQPAIDPEEETPA